MIKKQLEVILPKIPIIMKAVTIILCILSVFVFKAFETPIGDCTLLVAMLFVIATVEIEDRIEKRFE